jgi:hypothetical protein
MISGDMILYLILQLVVGGMIAYICWWALGKIALPEPFAKIALVLLVVIIAIWLINILLTLSGHPLVRFR